VKLYFIIVEIIKMTEQPTKRQATENNQTSKGEKNNEKGEKNNETGNRFLRKIRDNKKKHCKRIEELKSSLFVPLTDKQIADDVSYVLKTIEHGSERNCELMFNFALKDKFSKPTYLYMLIYQIRETLNTDLRYKEDIEGFEKTFDTFRYNETRRLALEVSQQIQFPFYDFDPKFVASGSKSSLHLSEYGIRLTTREGGWAIFIWWGSDPE
jgi:hypothetical protein